MTHLKEGDPAPPFTGKNQAGEEVSLADFRGKKLVLYFYPKDNTPTCTEEACSLRDNYQRFLAQGYAILGVSPDSERKHRNFITKYNLPFPLLADTDQEIVRRYGVWGPKQLFGHWYDGVHRTTFIINEQGIIERIITKVDSRSHAGQILE